MVDKRTYELRRDARRRAVLVAQLVGESVTLQDEVTDVDLVMGRAGFHWDAIPVLPFVQFDTGWSP